MGSSSSRSNKGYSPRDPGGGDDPRWRDFPTYNTLRRAQKEYTQNHKQQNAVKDPLRPFPPLTSREDVYRAEDFTEIDEHAKNTPLHLAAESYDALCSHLVEPATNDVQRVRAFYVWIASQNPDVVTFYTNGKTPDERSPLYPLLVTLLRKWRKGYAYLFYHMCKTVGIPCQRVRGLVKGASYQPGKPVKGKNTYCIVYVDGSWRFVDQHWGSASATKEKNTFKKDKDEGEEPEEEFLMHYKVDDFWFLTDPEVMIHTHFPDDPSHQLLARKVTLDEFQQMPDINEHYFRYEFTSLTPPVNMVRTDTGNVDIHVGIDKKRYYDFKYDLLKYGEKGPTIKMYRNIYLNQMVFMVGSERYLKLHIELPEIGKYRLEIGAKDLNEEDPDFKRFCSYVIYCREPNFDYKVYPYQEEERWGLFSEGRYLGLHSNVKEGVILAPDGIAEFSITQPSSKDILFSHTTENASYGKEYLSSYLTQFRYGRETVFLSKLPAHGSYICKVYAQEQGEENELKQLVARYLIMCSKGCADMTPYPSTQVGQGKGSFIRWASRSTLASPLNGRNSTFSEGTAPSTDSGYSGYNGMSGQHPMVLPITHKHPVINNVDTGKLEIILETRNCEHLEFLTNLQRHLSDGKLQEQSEYVLSHRTPTQLVYNIRFLQAGFHTFNIYYQQSDKKSGTQFGFAYLIHVTKPLSDCLPFPALGVDWQDEYQLISPHDGLLEPNSKVSFRVKITRAKQVYIKYSGDGSEDGRQEHLQDKGKDVWSQDVSTGSAYTDINMYYTGLDDQEGHLATYKVVSLNELQSVKDAQQHAAREAQRRQDEVLKRRRALEAAAESRRQREEEAVRTREEEFERERRRKEQEEEERERRERANAAQTPATQPEDGPLDTRIDDAYLQRIAEDRRKKWVLHHALFFV